MCHRDVLRPHQHVAMRRGKRRGGEYVSLEENEGALGYNIDSFLSQVIQETRAEDEAKHSSDILEFLMNSKDDEHSERLVQIEEYEKAVLRHKVLLQRYGTITPMDVLVERQFVLPSPQELEEQAYHLLEHDRYHICERTVCNPAFLEPGKMYHDPLNPGTTRKAVGKIYVCSLTGEVHMCGTDRCTKGEPMPKSEGVVCPISGYVVGSIISHYDPLNFVYDKNGTELHTSCRTLADDYQSDDPDDTSERRMNYDYAEFCADEFASTAEESSRTSNGRMGSLHTHNDTQYYVPKTGKRGRRRATLKRGRVGTLFAPDTQLSKRRRVHQSGRSTMEQEQRERIVQRTYNDIRNIVKDFLGANRMKMLGAKILPREKEVCQSLSRAQKTARTENAVPFTLKDFINIHVSRTYHVYRAMIPMAVAPESPAADIDYYTECLFHLWAIVNESHYANMDQNNLNFVACIVALLYMLKTGFVVRVTIDSKGRVRPQTLSSKVHYRKDDEDEDEESAISMKGFMEFIPPHRRLSLYLPPQNDIQYIEMLNYRSQSARSERQFYKASPMQGKKEIRKCYVNLLTDESKPRSVEDIQKYALYTRMKIRTDDE